MSPNFGWDGDAATDGEQETSETQTSGSNSGIGIEEQASGTVSIEGYDVHRIITDEFGEAVVPVAEAVLATHATMLLDDIRASRGMMIVGPSGSGKTLLLRSIDKMAGQFIRRDNITPASFVSAEPSKDENELEAGDLLPMLDGKSLSVRDAGPWFGGGREIIKSRWTKMASVMDGDGYVRHTASHGTRGYEDIRFNFVGATTPLPPTAWDVMGNVGQRLLFIKWPEEDCEVDEFGDMLRGGEREVVERTRSAIEEFLSDLWRYYGGRESVTWHDESLDDDITKVLYTLSEVVRHARATVYDNGDRVEREANKRIGRLLYDLARGHALLHGRRRIEADDLGVCARVALSTMPAKRRPLIRLLLDPSTGEELTRSDVQRELDVSRKTALKRMDRLAALGLAEVYKTNVQGGETKTMAPSPAFVWPEELLEFPEV